MRGTSRLVQGLRYLVGTLRRQRLIANELILHLPTIVRSFDLSLELLVVLRIRATSQHRYAGYGCNEPSRPRKDPGRLRSYEVPPRSADKAQYHHSSRQLRLVHVGNSRMEFRVPERSCVIPVGLADQKRALPTPSSSRITLFCACECASAGAKLC